MNQRIDGTGGEHAVGQRFQHGRNQHRLIREQLRAHQTHLRMQGSNFRDGNIRNLAAGAAGSGDHDQAARLGQLLALKEQFFALITAAEHHQLGDINDRTAADGDHAIDPAIADRA